MAATIHLAVMKQPYLERVLSGVKTIESRFAAKKCAPHGVVDIGDVVYFKEQSGPIRARGVVTRVEEWLHPSRRALERILTAYRDQLMLDDNCRFSVLQKAPRYATLLWLSSVAAIGPIVIAKRDRRPWVVVSQAPTLLGSNSWENLLVQVELSEVVLGLAGAIGAGKSTVAAYLTERWGYHQESFGSIVRDLQDGDAPQYAREDLDSTGARILGEGGASALANVALAGCGHARRCVLDGVRHLSIASYLRSLLGVRFRLVFVEADEEHRLQWLRHRGRGEDEAQLNSSGLQALDAAETEREVPLLKSQADVVIRNDHDVAQLGEAVDEYIQTLKKASP